MVVDPNHHQNRHKSEAERGAPRLLLLLANYLRPLKIALTHIVPTITIQFDGLARAFA
jgi:hypothetical protein